VTIWRISDYPELNGTGGLRSSARWHTAGRPIVYCAPNPATALLEVLVHVEIDIEDFPDELQYLEIDAPDKTSVATVDVDALGRAWQHNEPATRRAGDEWLRSARTALIRVPSAVVPATWNLLLNPQHPESLHVRVTRVHKAQHGCAPGSAL
jgi:RES domain-containing protein